MKKLLIVESPAKIKTISKFLGKDFKIVSTLGHIKDLPQKKLGVTIDEAIEIEYVVLDKKDKVIAEICKEAHRAGEIFLAPDPDREGEIIAWHVAQEIQKCNPEHKPLFRIAFNEITKPAVEEAIAHPSEIDMNKVAAQQARRVLDRWVGYEVSPILWKKVSKGLSAGRVQSVALRLICDREEEIRNFTPQEYWTIDGVFKAETAEIIATLTHKNKKKVEIKNQAEATKIAHNIEQQSFTIASIKDSKRLKNPAPPFMTSTLQQAAYNQLGFSVDKTMMLAQRLYEGLPLEDDSTPVALITYMRTDSLRIAESALKSARQFIAKTYGDDYLPAKALLYAKGGAQDAHEAIRPIAPTITPEFVARYIDKDAARLYELIWKRFIASQMKAAQYAQRQVTIEGGPYTFRVTGSTLIFDGFLKVYTESDEQEQDEKEKKTALPAHLKEKMGVELSKLNPKQHFTESPPRYTQASLVKELEREKIGRPSTYATILKTIQARAYTTLDSKKRFVPTELGMLVIKLLVQHLPQIMNIKFTALMEEDLDAIARGVIDRDKLLKGFYAEFEKDVKAFAGNSVKKALEPLGIACPSCHEGELVIRFGKAGPFAGCRGFPNCTFTSNFTRTEEGAVVLQQPEAPRLLTEKCPECDKNLREVSGKRGPFIACSGYPECTYIKPVVATFPCPQCANQLVRRFGKGKIFWGCSSYPACRFTIAGDILQEPCPQCDSPYLLKRVKQGETVGVCPAPECKHILS
jgi:DNA topoisomerase I